MTKNAIHSLNDQGFLEPFCLRCIETAKKDEEKKSKRKALNSKLVSVVKVLREKWGHAKILFFNSETRLIVGLTFSTKKTKGHGNAEEPARRMTTLC